MSYPTAPLPARCIFSGDGAGAQARIDHAVRPPAAVLLVEGVTSLPLPACAPCANAWAKDGYTVRVAASSIPEQVWAGARSEIQASL